MANTATITKKLSGTTKPKVIDLRDFLNGVPLDGSVLIHSDSQGWVLEVTWADTK